MLMNTKKHAIGCQGWRLAWLDKIWAALWDTWWVYMVVILHPHFLRGNSPLHPPQVSHLSVECMCTAVCYNHTWRTTSESLHIASSYTAAVLSRWTGTTVMYMPSHHQLRIFALLPPLIPSLSLPSFCSSPLQSFLPPSPYLSSTHSGAAQWGQYSGDQSSLSLSCES